MPQPLVVRLSSALEFGFESGTGSSDELWLRAQLFYMFWQMPRDAMQVHAAKELYKRGWRYHTSQAQWFTQESGQFFVFDTNAWDRIPYPERVDPRQLMASFLQEAELDTALASAEQ